MARLTDEEIVKLLKESMKVVLQNKYTPCPYCHGKGFLQTVAHIEFVCIMCNGTGIRQ